MTPETWIVGRDTGISSRTIWAVMMHAVPRVHHPFDFNVPQDPADFGRCYRLLHYFPEWRKRLFEVGEKFPEWKPMIREWDILESIFERDAPTGKSDDLFYRLQELIKEGREFKNL